MQMKPVLLAAALFVAWPAQSQDRAKTLHDTYCLMCHTTQVYTRDDRLADNYEQIRAQVDRWQGNVSLKWNAGDIDLVTAYLARHYYKMPCPMMDC